MRNIIDFNIDETASIKRVTTIEQIARIAELSANYNPVYMDSEYTKKAFLIGVLPMDCSA